MPRKLVQDVCPPESKTIRNIFISEECPVKIPRKLEPRKSKTGSRVGVWILALICLIFLVFSITLLFSSAEVLITLKRSSIILDNKYNLGYEVMTIEKKEGTDIAATGTREIKAKAHGTITVFNNFSSSSQVLTKNTRFENSQGKIYRINSALIVPGKTTVGVKDVAGSIDTTVFADEEGDSYNMMVVDLAGDFKIPGFKGGAKYNGFLARLKSDISGGASGFVATASPKVIAAARISLRKSLEAAVLKNITSQIPEGFVFYDKAYLISYESLPDKSDDPKFVTVAEKAILSAVIFNEKKLAQSIVPKISDDITKGDVVIEGLRNLQFSFINKTNFIPNASSTLSFALKGSLSAVSQFSEKDLKRSLSGKSASYVPTILEGFPGIKSTDITIKPFWKRSFPNDEAKITIKKLTP
ncbi:MAG: hypothetical protein EXS50_00790 [Candidatus Taylorbacteria bacterium]|nr:hypothetical protein [Candidatus Taylorbacteria bacterium]